MGEAQAVRTILTEIAAGPPKATVREIATSLGRLAQHYWRPDFTPEQAKLLYGDFVRLLDGATAAEFQRACDEWVMDPLNRFFPTPGQLGELMRWHRAQRSQASEGAKFLLNLMGDTAPAPGARDARKMLAELGERMKAR
jgi:hypothetical protein